MKSAVLASLFLITSASQAAEMCHVRYEGNFHRSEVLKSALQLKGYFESAQPEYTIRLAQRVHRIEINHSTYLHFDRRFVTILNLPGTEKAKAKASFEWTGFTTFDAIHGIGVDPLNPSRMSADETAALESMAEKLPACSSLK